MKYTVGDSMIFKSDAAIKAIQYIKEKYDVEPAFLWEKFPDTAAFRHWKTLKWFGVMMTVQKKKLGIDAEGKVEALVIKCDPILIGTLINGKGYLPAYHMNKEHWITVLLDGSVPESEICDLIDLSYSLT